MKGLWNRLFLEERPSIGLSFFRVAVALTVGFHVIPSLCQLPDNYYHTAFKTFNYHFFPPQIIGWVQQSPDGLVNIFVALFFITWLFYLIGFFTQLSGILMAVACYYFYALNSFHIGTLSWDILLVTLFLMLVSPYSGDYFSVDALRQGNPQAYKTLRPFFVQRLLQMQIAFTYFYTGLYKITAEGNWFADNPIYYLMNAPAEGVTKYFLLRDYMAGNPEFCYAVGKAIVITELCMPLLLFWRRTRIPGIVLGCFFQLLLLVTLNVPAIFFFLFPPQLLLFINPKHVVRWIDNKRSLYSRTKRYSLIYDGHCQFCRSSIRKLEVMDMFGRLEPVDYQTRTDLQVIHPKLSKETAHSQLHLVEPDGSLRGGFFVLRRLSIFLPMMYPLIPVLYFPGSGVVGPLLYRWLAKNRYLFHSNRTCKDNACFRN